MSLPSIFLLTGEFPPRVGGIADYTARLAEHLSADGLDVTVLVGSDHPLEQAGPPLAHRVERLDDRYNSWRLLPAVARRLSGGPAIVHIQYQTAAFGMHPAIHALPLWLRLRVPGARVVVTCHDVRVPYLFPKAGPLRELVTHGLIDGSHAAIFSDADDRHWAGARPNHWLIPIGSGIPVVPLQCAAVDPTPGVFRLGYFGFMNSSKGITTLLEAVSALAASGRTIRLVFIGDALGDADMTNARTRQSIDDAIRRLNLVGLIERTGTLSLRDVSRAIQACDALALPFEDGASYRRSSLTAALVHGRPVITTLAPTGKNGLPGFESGVSVLMVPPGDAAALAGSIELLIGDASLRARLAQGAAVASTRLQWPSIAAAVREVYASVTGAGFSGRALV
ncbi:MAG: glycosyltransferase [Chloroflexota bacterium]